jgi:predicted aldo/keto reductase-like oxidoreductase
MTATPVSDKTALLTDLSPYVYGTGRLGDNKIPFEDRVRVARVAMEAGVWFHTSHTYGDTLSVLRAAFDQDRTKVPKLIVKIGWSRLPELRDIIRQNLEPLNINNLELGQLCLSGALAEDYANGGECYAEFARIKQEGLVHRLVLEVFPWTSPVALKALRGGYPQGIVDGYIFYFNPLQRFVSNELWAELHARNEPIIALRTVGGGPVHRLRDVPGAAWASYIQQRAVEAAPIFERSGIPNWTDFCMRFAFSYPQVRATIGATSHPENFKEYLAAAQAIQPLPGDLRAEIETLQHRWSDEVDRQAEPWTM